MTRQSAPPVIRPPWPDEAARTLAFLDSRTVLEGTLHPLVAVCGETERLVGAVCLAEGANPSSRVGVLHLQIRPRFLAGPLMAELLGRMEVLGRALGLHLLSLQLPGSSPMCGPLMAAGFQIRRSDTWWTATRNAAMELRFARARQLLVKSAPRHPGITVSPLHANDLPAVNAILKVHQIADLEAAGTSEVAAGMEMSHDPQLSTVVRIDGSLAGVQLVRRMGTDTLFVHARAVHPDFMALSGHLNLCFFARFLEPEFLPIQRWVFSARPEVEKETAAMAARFGARKSDSFTLFGKSLI